MAGRYVPYLWSLLIHLLLLGLLALSLQSTPLHTPQVAANPQPEPIQAAAVDESKVLAEVDRLRSEEQQRRTQEESRQRKLQDEAQRMKEARQQEEQRLADLKKQAEERKTREAAEQQRLAALEKQRADEQKRLADVEAKRKIAETKAKQADEQRKKDEAQADLRKKLEAAAKQMAAEDQQRSKAQAQQNLKLVAQYKSDIAMKVRRNWLRPSGTTDDFQCTVLVHQMPTGDVLDVLIEKSCGSPVLDRSVENAVRKSSPLPPPPVPEVWDREIEFIFTSK